MTRLRGVTEVTGLKGLTGVPRVTSVTEASKEGEGGGEEEGKHVTIAGRTNNEQGKIGQLSQLTMEG